MTQGRWSNKIIITRPLKVMIMLKLLRFRSGNSFLFNSPSNFGVLIRKPVQDQSTTLNAHAKMWSLSLVPKRSSFYFFSFIPHEQTGAAVLFLCHTLFPLACLQSFKSNTNIQICIWLCKAGGFVVQQKWLNRSLIWLCWCRKQQITPLRPSHLPEGAVLAGGVAEEMQASDSPPQCPL